MLAVQAHSEFGPIGHENGLPKAPEHQTHQAQETEVGILPGDSESRKALIRLNKLRAEGADPGVVGDAEAAVAQAAQLEQQQAAEAARAEIDLIHAEPQDTQPAPSAEATTPYPVHTIENFGQRPVAINLTPQHVQGPHLTGDSLQGSQLAAQVRHDQERH